MSRYALKFVENAYPYESYSSLRELDDQQKRAKEERVHQFNVVNKNESFARDEADMTGILQAGPELGRQSGIKEYLEGMHSLQQYYQVGRHP